MCTKSCAGGAPVFSKKNMYQMQVSFHKDMHQLPNFRLQKRRRTLTKTEASANHSRRSVSVVRQSASPAQGPATPLARPVQRHTIQAGARTRPPRRLMRCLFSAVLRLLNDTRSLQNLHKASPHCANIATPKGLPSPRRTDRTPLLRHRKQT